MDANDRRPFEVVLYGISLALLIVASIPSFLPKSARVLVVLFVGYIHYRTIFTQTTGDFASDLGSGSGFLSQYLIGSAYALFLSPEDLVDYCDGEVLKVTQRPFRKRVEWTLRLYSNPRGIGWAHEPLHLPHRPSSSTPRWKFFFSRILFAIGCFSSIGVVYVVNASNPGLTTPGLLLSEASLPWRLLGVIGFGLGGIFMISGVNSLLSAVIVGCGYSSPSRWPWLFGSPFQLWSIRRFWRRFWHQMIRGIVLTYSSIFLGFIFPRSETNTIRFRLARLYTAFFISGIIHMAGDAMVTGKIIFKAFTFFMLQPVGITIEIFVGHLWRQVKDMTSSVDNDDVEHSNTNGKSRINGSKQNKKIEEPIPPIWIRCVGLIWLVYWMAWTAPYIVDPLCAVGVFRDPRVDLRRFL